MKYCELTTSEKNELRETLFFESASGEKGTDFDMLSDAEKEIVVACSWWDEISEEIMESAYGMYDFVEQDFFCNTEDQFCDRLGNPIEVA